MGVVLMAPSKPLGAVRKRRRLAEFVVKDIEKMDRTVIQASPRMPSKCAMRITPLNGEELH